MIALVVSGGHTQLVLVYPHTNFLDFKRNNKRPKDVRQKVGMGVNLKYKLIGETLDDAAGEAFDKVAKLLGLGYPGGPVISKMAEKGNPSRYSLPRPMIKENNFNFSFSGLKTAVLYLYRKGEIKKQDIPDLCASFQEAAVDTLVAKTIRAAKEFKANGIILGGGVSANKRLREKMKSAIKKEFSTRSARSNNNDSTNSPQDIFPLFVAKPALCTDNAIMIGLTGYYHAQKKDFANSLTLEPNPNMEL